MRVATNVYRRHAGEPKLERVDPARLSADLGGKWHRHYGVAPCPVCQTERRKDQDALTLSATDNKLLLHCKKSGCDFRDILCAAGIAPGHFEIDLVAQQQAERARKDQAEKLKARARSAWSNAGPIAGTAGEAYLRSRGIACALPDTLRWAYDAYHQPSGKFCGMMIADVQPTGGVHRTYFDKSGVRIGKSAKMMLGPCAGGAVRLSEAIGPLVVCEGIETGLSLLSGLLDGPHGVWAALSTSGMKGLSLPPRSGRIVIAPDGDPPGREAAHSLARTATGLGWTVSMLTPPDGLDWNDVLQREVAV